MIGDSVAQCPSSANMLSYFTLEGADIGIEHWCPVVIDHARISNTFTTTVHSHSNSGGNSLQLSNSVVGGSGGRGVWVGPQVVATISSTTIDNHADIGVTCVQCSLTVANGTSISNNGLHGLKITGISGSAISLSTIDDNSFDGIRAETGADAVITSINLNGNKTGLNCWYNSDPSVTYSSIKTNNVGAGGAETASRGSGTSVVSVIIASRTIRHITS